MNTPSFYDILKITPEASDNEVKSAYRSLVKTYHPDFNPHNRKTAELKLKALNEAYHHLKTREKRTEYNKTLSLSATNDNVHTTFSLITKIRKILWPVQS